ncbi:MAG TPA: hypothetical protein DCM08_08600 [Microscillaceae bacterium]|jgi:putative membrane protein|nr:hypothetical protein [Microscillaceae bacterium]
MRQIKIINQGLMFFISVVGVAIFMHPNIFFDSIIAALMVTVLLSAINAFIKPGLQTMAMPLNFLTLGFFPILLNVGIIYLLEELVPGFIVSNFFWGIIFSLLVSFVYSLLHWFFENFIGIDALKK